jgi:hypothetical protein
VGTIGVPAGRGLHHARKSEGGGKGRVAASRHTDVAPITCRVCERLVRDRGTGRTLRELHRPCKEFLGYLRAAERKLREIDFAEGARQRWRGKLIAGLVNAIPARWQRPRDERGRFTAESRGRAQ